MANNRLYIRCSTCGAICGLAKHFSSEWLLYKGIEKNLQNFFDEHAYCEDYNEYGDMDAEFNQFELVSEFGYGYPEIIDIDAKGHTRPQRKDDK